MPEWKPVSFLLISLCLENEAYFAVKLPANLALWEGERPYCPNRFKRAEWYGSPGKGGR